jgi:chromosomal replication initiation ATPase DnaA
VTRKQLGDALAIALHETRNDLEEAAQVIARMVRADGKHRSIKAKKRRADQINDPQVLDVLKEVAKANGISVTTMIAGTSTAISWIRFEAMWNLRYLGMSMPAIAEVFGLANHTSVLYGVKRHQEKLERIRRSAA